MRSSHGRTITAREIKLPFKFRHSLKLHNLTNQLLMVGFSNLQTLYSPSDYANSTWGKWRATVTIILPTSRKTNNNNYHYHHHYHVSTLTTTKGTQVPPTARQTDKEETGREANERRKGGGGGRRRRICAGAYVNPNTFPSAQTVVHDGSLRESQQQGLPSERSWTEQAFVDRRAINQWEN